MAIFIQKGDAPMSYRQAIKRGKRILDAERQHWEREQAMIEGSAEFQTWAEGWIADNVVNGANNLFNHQLDAYRKAVARLEQYRLADGKPEQTIETPTGTFDEEGNEIMDVTVIPVIDPLPAEIEQPVYDEEGNQIGTEMVANPAIVEDDAQRAQAQAVIDGTAQEVKDF